LLECDLLEVLQAAYNGNLGDFKGQLPSAESSGNGAAVCVTIASQGYPDKYAAGMPIRFKVGFDLGPHSQLIDNTGDIDHNLARILFFHAGTKLDAERSLITAGGRVAGVTALASDLSQAREAVYKAVSKIDFAGKHHRNDIALLEEASISYRSY
jgi:phosphoribosylamine--glycine ligase